MSLAAWRFAAGPDPAPPGGVSDRAHIFIAVIVLAALIFTVHGVRSYRLRSRYSLLWLVIVVALVPLAVFPGLLDTVSVKLGIDYPPTTFLSLSVAFLFLVVVHLSWELSRAEDRLRTMAEDFALFRAEVDHRLPPETERGPGLGEAAGQNERSAR